MECTVAPGSTNLSGTTLGCIASKFKIKVFVRFGERVSFPSIQACRDASYCYYYYSSAFLSSMKKDLYIIIWNLFYKFPCRISLMSMSCTFFLWFLAAGAFGLYYVSNL